jgi:hypothetical protein
VRGGVTLFTSLSRVLAGIGGDNTSRLNGLAIYRSVSVPREVFTFSYTITYNPCII